MKKLFKILIPCAVVAVTACGTLGGLAAGGVFDKVIHKTEYEYIYDEDAPQIKDGQTSEEQVDPYQTQGLYTDPELKIDGKRDEEYNTKGGHYIVYRDYDEHGVLLPEEEQKQATDAFIYKGDKGIYFLFECHDDDISTIHTEDINLATAQSDSIELYLDTYGSGGFYRSDTVYEFRVNADEVIYSYLTGFVAHRYLWGNSTVNFNKDVDEGWSVEGYIAYNVLGNDVSKLTPTSFQFARVVKTGSMAYRWMHSGTPASVYDIDPQVPNNYVVLANQKFYPLNEAPISARVQGTILDTKGEPVAIAEISDGTNMTFSNRKGYFDLDVSGLKTDLTLTFEKEGFIPYSTTIKKEEFRKTGTPIVVENPVLIKESENSYSTTIQGSVYARDGVTPLENVKVEVNGCSGYSNEEGQYSFAANLKGYSNTVYYSKENYESFNETYPIKSINIDGTTELEKLCLDDTIGDSIGFGNEQVGFATARLTRNNDSVTIVMKTDKDMDQDNFPQSYFELFLDTKESYNFGSANECVDPTGFKFCIAYKLGIISAQRIDLQPYSFPATGVTTSSGKIHGVSYVEITFNYDYLGIEKDEVFGLYFGIKHYWNWAGMYDNRGNYIHAENTRKYVRVSQDGLFYSGSTNYEPEVGGTYTLLSLIGVVAGDPASVLYEVYVARDESGVTLKFVPSTPRDITTHSHSLNIYVDNDYSSTRSGLGITCSHIAIYPGNPVSHYSTFSSSGSELPIPEEQYEERATKVWTDCYLGVTYVYLAYDIFGGNASSTIGFSMTYWSDIASEADYLVYSGKSVTWNVPSDYVQVKPDGSLGIK